MLGRNGLYYIDQEIYCVKIAGRTLEEMQKTEAHELCHHLVKKNYEHFCTDNDIMIVG